MGERQRIGVFGGTFDPIHLGHLILAEEAKVQLKLDRIYLVPAGDPPHKQERKLTPVAHRICMAELAAAEVDYLWVSRVDADRAGPHYTVDMLHLLQQALGPTVELYFLMGMDSLRDLPTWRQPMWIVQNCKLVALSRHAVDLDWEEIERTLPGLRTQLILLDMPEIEIASHTIQERVRSGGAIRHQVPRAVEAYIRKQRLYLDDR